METTINADKVQANLTLMHTYFDSLFGKDLSPMLNMMDDNTEWLVAPTGEPAVL